jgi:hypothetical protein
MLDQIDRDADVMAAIALAWVPPSPVRPRPGRPRAPPHLAA